MDIISHGLFAYSISQYKKLNDIIIVISIIAGALIPDVGEIFIQNELSKKYGATIAVYDERTSDAIVASNLNVTFIYDSLHSLMFPTLLFFISLFITHWKKYIQFFSIGVLSHIFLDSFTHGKVWALKLFYPLSNNRIRICENTIGNWWDWSPKINIFFFPFPLYCICFWVVLLAINRILKIKK